MLKEDPFFGGVTLFKPWIGLSLRLTGGRPPKRPVSKSALRRGDHHVGNSADCQWPVSFLETWPSFKASDASISHRGTLPTIASISYEMREYYSGTFPYGCTCLEKWSIGEGNGGECQGKWWLQVFSEDLQTEFPELLVWDTFWVFRHNMIKYDMHTDIHNKLDYIYLSLCSRYFYCR